MSKAVPDTAHPRGIRWAGWLVRRVSARKVRVTGEKGYVDVRLGPGAEASDATALAAIEVSEGRAAWTPVHKASGRSGGASAARAPQSGVLRVEAYLGEEASAALATLRARLGSNRAALEWALTHAPPPAA